VKSLYSASDIPETLYHYTSTTGLIGILESRALWASELRYLNDSAELSHGYRLIVDEVRAKRIRSSESSEVLGQLERWLDLRSRFGPMVFVAAFTGSGNLLSQWRAYCPPAGGVSFGLAATHLQDVCQASEFSLARCVYTAVEQSDLVRKLVQEVVLAAEATGPNPLAPKDESFHSTFLELEESIMRVCAVLKHSAFREEAEWRAVSKAFSDFVRREGARINYRAGRSMLVPYIPLPLANSNKIIPIDIVITGPTPDPAAAEASIQRCVARHINNMHASWTSRYCEIPYRAW